MLSRAVGVLAKSDLQVSEIAAEYALLVKSYRSMLRKLNKTMIISDSYQLMLVELNNTLLQKVEEETERRLLRERMLAQQNKLAAMGEMIGAIAHQWRQPLSTVSAILQNIVAVHKLGKLDDAYMTKAARKAESQILFMSETIDAFRGFFRPAKDIECFNVTAKIIEAASFIQTQLTGDGIALVLPEQMSDCITLGFPNEFTQVILNLLTNSRDAINEKRRKGARGDDYRIEINVASESSRIVVEVCDNGCGIAQEAASRLFEPYYTTKSGSGTGIGLYMSRMIIEESMGGRIFFSNRPDGTVFSIELPVRDMPS